MRTLLKEGMIRTLDALGVYGKLPQLGGQRLLIPCYHSVVSEARTGRRAGYENSVSEEEFAQHLEWLGRNYRFVDLAGALAWIERPTPGPPPVLISFDDGYRNNLSLAAPILRRYGAPAIFFLSSDYIGGDRLLWPLEIDVRLEHSPGARISIGQMDAEIPLDPQARAALAFQLRQTLKKMPNSDRVAAMDDFRASTQLDPSRIDHELHDFLSWDEARQLSRQGFAIGSHTCTHPILSRLNTEELRHELADSKDRLELELDQPVTTLAYPNGGKSDYSAEIVEMTRQCGYSNAFAVDESFQKARTNPQAASGYELSRIIVQGHMPQTQFRFLASGVRNLLRGRL